MEGKKDKIESLEEQIKTLQEEVERLKKGETEVDEKREEEDENEGNLSIRRPHGFLDEMFPMFSIRSPFMPFGYKHHPYSEQKKREKETDDKKKDNSSMIAQPFTYSSSYSYSKLNDMIHEKKKEEDSRRGITKEMESRTIGNRSLRFEKKTRKGESEPVVKTTVKNLELEDMSKFEEEWTQRVTGKKRKRLEGDQEVEENKKLPEPPKKKRKKD